MNRHYPIEKSKYIGKHAESVTYCPDCGSPVVVAPLAMEEHVQRVHVQGPARPITVPVPRWEREW